jgi:hypothetical protein
MTMPLSCQIVCRILHTPPPLVRIRHINASALPAASSDHRDQNRDEERSPSKHRCECSTEALLGKLRLDD